MQTIYHSIELDELYKNIQKKLRGNDFWPSFGHSKIEKVKGPPFGSKKLKKFSIDIFSSNDASQRAEYESVIVFA
jgi:hypothetical protein